MDRAMGGGPVAVAIEADKTIFQFYTSGIITGSACGDLDLDHAVLAVGYEPLPKNHSSGCKAYATIKNSWGT